MNEITLEKIDIIRERTGANYSEAKEALELSEGDVIEALIYMEKNSVSKKQEMYQTAEEFVNWLKELVKKGNVNRIVVKKDDKTVFDIPVNAGVATGFVGLIFPGILAIIGVGTVAAVFTNFTIEITKTDGSVEVVNKIIKSTANNVKDKVSDFANEVMDKFNHKKEKQEPKEQVKKENEEENVYKYTVKFDDIEDDSK
ncbi:MAG: DUF4342 domain-containing protein [Clostridiaceae bacterium]|nr:DUF4342 domain-containing protein [Clostridiaceae bacterium]